MGGAVLVGELRSLGHARPVSAPWRRLGRRARRAIPGDRRSTPPAGRWRPPGPCVDAVGSLEAMSRRARILAIALVGLLVVGTTIAVRLGSGSSVESSRWPRASPTWNPPTTVPPTTTTTIDPAEQGFVAAHAGSPRWTCTPRRPTRTRSVPGEPHRRAVVPSPSWSATSRGPGSRSRSPSGRTVPRPGSTRRTWSERGAQPHRRGGRRPALTVYEGHSDEAVMSRRRRGRPGQHADAARPLPRGHLRRPEHLPPWILVSGAASPRCSTASVAAVADRDHGWSDTSVLGQNVSNGCVRVSFDDLWRPADLAPVGTPVDIVA